jgi:hypothetical protein
MKTNKPLIVFFIVFNIISLGIFLFVPGLAFVFFAPAFWGISFLVLSVCLLCNVIVVNSNKEIILLILSTPIPQVILVYFIK